MTKPFRYVNVAAVAHSNSWNALTNMVELTRLKSGLSTFNTQLDFQVDKIKDSVAECILWFEHNPYVVMQKGVYNYHIVLDDPDHDCFHCAVSLEISEDTLEFNIRGSRDHVDIVTQWVNGKFAQAGAFITIVDDVQPGGLVIANRKHIIATADNKALDSFYPWMTLSLEQYFKAFMESPEPVLVLFGPPGTGKSTFIRSLITSGPYDATLTYNKNAIESTKTLSMFYKNSSRIMVYEDIDLYLDDREKGNTLMSGFLNGSDGIVEHPHKKIIFSTNLPDINRIDPALLRAGRCFDILKFEELTQEQAAQILIDMDRDPKTFTQSKINLATVLSQYNKEQQTINRFGTKTGFA